MKPYRTLSSSIVIAASLLITACDSDDNNDSRVVLGTGNEIFELGILQYQTPFVVQVTDAESNPAPGATVTFTLKPLSYFKGNYIATDTDNDLLAEPDQWVPTATAPECFTEDTNSNGALDAGEDTDADGILDPSNSATITAHPDRTPTITPGTATLVTDENGFGYLAVTYPKSEAAWVKMQMIAEVQDSLPGNTVTHTFTLQVLLADVQNLTVAPPGGQTSPYGSATVCSDPS